MIGLAGGTERRRRKKIEKNEPDRIEVTRIIPGRGATKGKKRFLKAYKM